MQFTAITKSNVESLSAELLVEAIQHYRVIEANALTAGPLAAGRHRQALASSCGDAQFMLERVLWPEQDRRRKAGRVAA